MGMRMKASTLGSRYALTEAGFAHVLSTFLLVADVVKLQPKTGIATW
jgi:hypothetical protein